MGKKQVTEAGTKKKKKHQGDKNIILKKLNNVGHKPICLRGRSKTNKVLGGQETQKKVSTMGVVWSVNECSKGMEKGWGETVKVGPSTTRKQRKIPSPETKRKKKKKW